MAISVISMPSTQFSLPPNQALTVENLGPGTIHWGRFAVDDTHNEGVIQPSNTITFFAPFGPQIFLQCDVPTSVNTTFVPFPNAAAMLGTDGTVGGSGGSPLSGVIPVINATDPAYGAKADAQQSTGSITSGQNTLTITAGNIPAVGQFVMVPGAGAQSGGAGGPFTGYVSSVASNVVTLVTTKGGSTPANASTTVSGKTVTFGTGCASAVGTALAVGKRVHMPAGVYVWDGAVTPSSLYLTGDGIGRTQIYFTSSQNPITVTGTGLVGTTAALTANAVAGAQSLSVASIPAGLSPGDFILLSSTTVFDAAESFCTCGEFCRVYGISGGNTIWLNSPLVGPFTYTTAASAQIQKVSFLEGVHVSDMEWINGTPEKFTAGPATPATPVDNAGNGNVIRVKKAAWATFENLKVIGWAGDFLGLTNCIHFRCQNVDARDGAHVPTASAGNSYGYKISAYGSQWGEIIGGSIEMCHGDFNAEGTGQVGGDIVLPSSTIEVRGVTSRNGIGEPFLCHNASAFIDFVDCKVVGGPLFPTEHTHDAGFQIVGHYCRVINPVISNASGRPLFLGNDHCEAIKPVIRNLAPWNDRCDAISVSGTNCRVVGADIDQVPNDPTLSSGRGIWVQSGATGFELAGKSTIRNTASDAIFIGDTSNTETVDGLTGINNARYVIETAAATPNQQWRNIAGINATLGITNKPGGIVPFTAYQLITANGTTPTLSSRPRIRAVGGGGGGGGGCSGAATAAYVGGGGGAGGGVVDVVASVTSSTLTIVVGAAGTNGAGGASGGNAGTAGGNGGTTTASDTGPSTVVAKGRGGWGGAAPGASATTGVGGGLWGTTGTSTSGGAGSGAQSGGTTSYPMLNVVGGSGGAAANATNGGNGGNAQLTGSAVDQISAGSGQTGSANGGTGVTATQLGCGGGGGGGGATATGVGGNGGSGAAGFVEIWW